jgi:hypothetical protein
MFDTKVNCNYATYLHNNKKVRLFYLISEYYMC